MRCLMTAGEALKRENIAGYNCSYVAIDRVQAFDENIQIPAYVFAYRTPAQNQRDSWVLNMISTYLSDGESSKLYKKIVESSKK